MHKILATVVCGLMLAPAVLFAQAEKEKSYPELNIKDGDKVMMLTYFRQRYPTRIEIDDDGNIIEVPLPDPMLEASLHIALSTDGRNWTPLNDNKPIWDQWMRDPYVRRGPDGTWHILATGGMGELEKKSVGPTCLYATSKDLIHWESRRSLPLMIAAKENGAFAKNIWAPEWFYDEENSEYVLVWSSSFDEAGWMNSRLWYSRTKDWKDFTPAKVLFDPPYSVIDGTILKEDGKYYLFHKEEEFGAKTGERRAIRLAVSDNLEGPYEIVEGHLNNGQIVPVITEGPSAIPDPFEDGYLLYYDFCMTNRFGVSYSDDLTNWVIQEDADFPDAARHGTVSIISSAEAEKLMETYPNKK